MAVDPRERPRRPFERKRRSSKGLRFTTLAFAVLVIAIIAVVVLIFSMTGA